GMAASMGAFLLSAGTKGKRFALPHSEIMIHQPLGGAKGQATDIEIQAKQILRIKATLNEILAANTGKPLEIIEKDTDRDNYMTAQEALDYGLIDKILTHRS
ncbi:MAG: ATP-dependent Clp protease proteolytic subunit, partial [Clostridia bacterium]|nr:ATP-dependent Clp protease proteolytic subunit [Clostridia bacterium]